MKKCPRETYNMAIGGCRGAAEKVFDKLKEECETLEELEDSIKALVWDIKTYEREIGKMYEVELLKLLHESTRQIQIKDLPRQS